MNKALSVRTLLGDYPVTLPLKKGEIRSPSVSFDFADVKAPSTAFKRVVRNLEFDCAELAIVTFLQAKAYHKPYVLLPATIVGRNQHHTIFYNADKRRLTARELNGTRVGVRAYTQTTGAWVRGFLAEDYGIDLSSIHWLQAGVNQPGRDEKVALTLPPGLRYEARPQASLSAMLMSGEIDAAITARAPDAFVKGDGKVVRLFPDYRAEEERFFKKTGIFPIMHLITLRRAAFEQHPWIAMNLYKAFDEAKRRCLKRLCDFTIAGTALPWIAAIADEIVQAQGEDPFPYGIEASRPTLEAFCRYCHDQGVTAQRMAPEDLFPPEVQASARV